MDHIAERVNVPKIVKVANRAMIRMSVSIAIALFTMGAINTPWQIEKMAKRLMRFLTFVLSLSISRYRIMPNEERRHKIEKPVER